MIWKDIKCYEGFYQVNNLGKVKSLVRKGNLKERILKPSVGLNKYLHVVLCKNGQLKTFSVHRLVAEAFILNPNNRSCINHKDGDKLNNKVWNLEWATYKENMRHADTTGLRNVKGEAHSLAKLTKADVIQIRESNLKQNKLAKIYKVSQSLISLIKHNKNWKHTVNL